MITQASARDWKIGKEIIQKPERGFVRVRTLNSVLGHNMTLNEYKQE